MHWSASSHLLLLQPEVDPVVEAADLTAVALAHKHVLEAAAVVGSVAPAATGRVGQGSERV